MVPNSGEAVRGLHPTTCRRGSQVRMPGLGCTVSGEVQEKLTLPVATQGSPHSTSVALLGNWGSPSEGSNPTSSSPSSQNLQVSQWAPAASKKPLVTSTSRKLRALPHRLSGGPVEFFPAGHYLQPQEWQGARMCRGSQAGRPQRLTSLLCLRAFKMAPFHHEQDGPEQQTNRQEGLLPGPPRSRPGSPVVSPLVPR